eukprot:Clim_evm30s238 gene=Clim_evmTU30s238
MLLKTEGEYELAKQESSRGLYHLTVKAGPHSSRCTGGIFQTAGLYMVRGGQETALALYDTVVSIWAATLITILSLSSDDGSSLSDDHASEARIRKTRRGEAHKTVGEACATLGLHAYATDNVPEALEFASKAYANYEQIFGKNDALTLSIDSFLKRIQKGTRSQLDCSV